MLATIENNLSVRIHKRLGMFTLTTRVIMRVRTQGRNDISYSSVGLPQSVEVRENVESETDRNEVPDGI
jgi:hypothetical protein